MVRSFVVGDIHGCITELFAELERLDFDPLNDKLYAVGDLVDRGPNSRDVLDLLFEPWFFSVRGNHESLMYGDDRYLHYINGGEWFNALGESDQQELAELVRQLPHAWTVNTPSGRRVGLVHADVFGNDWDEFMRLLGNEEPHVQWHAMWSRERVRLKDPPAIKNIDHVYFGHTPLKEPRHYANMSWIDTGCFATGKITIVELL